MKNKKLESCILVLLGALLLGFLWRVRGTNGWGSSWGLLNAGFVFTLFLIFATKRTKGPSLQLTALTALSFMLTVPAWGTFLDQCTGILTATNRDGETVLYEISPLSGVAVMLLLGFGLASVYGILLGRGFGGHAWRLRDYAAVLLVFIIVDLAAKATVSHLILKLIEPQAVTAFVDGLKSAGETSGAYGAYMSHFSAVSWAKQFTGGRNYFSSVGTISLVLAAIACLLTTRFYVRDKYAAKTGAVVCAAFAISITVSDLFFFFAKGGYHYEQGFTLPDGFAAWSLWEYFTGFIAGGIITAYLLKTASEKETNETLLQKVPAKPRQALCFLFAVIAGIGVNAVRPVLVRLDGVAAVLASVVVGLFVMGCAFLFYKKTGKAPYHADLYKLSPVLCLVFVLWIYVVYMFISRPEGRAWQDMKSLHNILVTVSAAALIAACGTATYKRCKS